MGQASQQQQQPDAQEWEVFGRSRASRLNKTLYSLPVHCLSDEDLQVERTKGMWQHFHRPDNSHNRFRASLTQRQCAILRTLERLPPYNSHADTPVAPGTAQLQHQHARGAGNTDSSRSCRQTRPAAQAAAAALRPGRQMACLDLLTGQPPTARICQTQPWRVAMVRSCVAVPGSSKCPAQVGKRAKQRAPAVQYQYFGPAKFTR